MIIRKRELESPKEFKKDLKNILMSLKSKFQKDII